MHTRAKIELLDRLAVKFQLTTNIRQDAQGNWQASSYTPDVQATAYHADFDEMLDELIGELAESGVTE